MLGSVFAIKWTLLIFLALDLSQASASRTHPFSGIAGLYSWSLDSAMFV